jgi:hypothetical protein
MAQFRPQSVFGAILLPWINNPYLAEGKANVILAFQKKFTTDFLLDMLNFEKKARLILFERERVCKTIHFLYV